MLSNNPKQMEHVQIEWSVVEWSVVEWSVIEWFVVEWFVVQWTKRIEHLHEWPENQIWSNSKMPKSAKCPNQQHRCYWCPERKKHKTTFALHLMSHSFQWNILCLSLTAIRTRRWRGEMERGWRDERGWDERGCEMRGAVRWEGLWETRLFLYQDEAVFRSTTL